MGKLVEDISISKSRLIQTINQDGYIPLGAFAISFKSMYGNSKMYLWYNGIEDTNRNENEKIIRALESNIKSIKREKKELEKKVRELEKVKPKKEKIKEKMIVKNEGDFVL